VWLGCCVRQYPQLSVFSGRFDRSVLQRIWQFSLYASIILTTAQVIYFTDTLVVGAFLSVSAVTFYAIGGGLNEYTLHMVQSVTYTFTPVASDLGARGHQASLRRLLIYGTRVVLLIGLAVQVALFIRGGTFIGLWMGQEYIQISSRILQILLVAQIFIIANRGSYGIIFGLEKTRPVALIGIAEAAVNLVLSVILARHLGLEGVAWGTVIPSLMTQLFFFPRYVCKLVDLPLWSYFWQAWIRTGLSVVPFAIACYIVDRHWNPPNLLFFFLQMLLLLPVLILSAACSFPKEAAELWRTRPAWLLPVAKTSVPLSEKS